MPNFIHIVETDYIPSFRSQKVAGMFDIPVSEKLKKEWHVNIPIEEKSWQIGLITGASGSGKSILSRRLFENKVHEKFNWFSKCLLDDFPSHLEISTITETLSKVGFSSPPSWLLPYSALSNGQKFRVELARCLLEYEDLFVFDEFSSVVDRQVAQISSHAFQKAVRKINKQFVAVTCHNDVEEWLQPDWVFDVSSNQFKWGCLRRPKINFEIFRVNYKAWNLFKDHHYLSSKINKSAACWIACIHNRPVSFTAWLPFFGKIKAYRDHRRVTLPDFQGLGLGNILLTENARMFKSLDYRVFSTTAHPAEVKKRFKSKEWKVSRLERTGVDTCKTYKRASNRLTCGSEFVGESMLLEDAINLFSK